MSTISNERLEEIAEEDNGSDVLFESSVLARELLALRKERERAEPVSLVVKHINDPYADPDFDEPPAPVADDDSEIKWRELALQFDGHRMQAICFLKQILNELPEAEFSSAREFLKAGPLSGEEVLRNRIADLAPPAPVVPDEIIELLHAARSYVKSCAGSDGHAFGVLRAIDRACRAAMLTPPAPVVVDDSLPFDPQIAEYEQMMEAEQAQADTTSQQFESLAGKVADGWIPCSERMPDEGGRYWCYVEEINSLGKSHYQWNCSWNGEGWGGEGFYGRVTHWQPLPEPPCK